MEIESASAAELSAVLAALNLHPLIIDDCLDPGYSTMIDRYDTTVYIEFPVDRSQPYDRVSYPSIIGEPNLLVTIRRGELPRIDEIAQGLQNQFHLYANRPAALLYQILNHLINQNTAETRKLRTQVDELTQAYIENAETVEFETIATLKRQASSLGDINEDQFYCLKSLVELHLLQLNIDEDKPFFHDLVSDAEYAFRTMGRQEDRLRDLQSDFQLMTHSKTEKRLRVLTILSAVLLPLTLISSIYGMNFDQMPLLHWRYGYGFIIVIMLLILGGMLYKFFRRGWFD